MNRFLLRRLDSIDPIKRRCYALALLEWSVVAYLLSAWAVYTQVGLTWFEQIMLVISFGAIWVTCVDIICTTDVRVQEDK
jgi:hypothetical protein